MAGGGEGWMGAARLRPTPGKASPGRGGEPVRGGQRCPRRSLLGACGQGVLCRALSVPRRGARATLCLGRPLKRTRTPQPGRTPGARAPAARPASASRGGEVWAAQAVRWHRGRLRSPRRQRRPRSLRFPARLSLSGLANGKLAPAAEGRLKLLLGAPTAGRPRAPPRPAPPVLCAPASARGATSSALRASSRQQAGPSDGKGAPRRGRAPSSGWPRCPQAGACPQERAWRLRSRRGAQRQARCSSARAGPACLRSFSARGNERGSVSAAAPRDSLEELGGN